ncbi:MAG: glutamate synthase, partial [bacterium]
LAESFMAGDPHNGGGFVVINGVFFDGHGRLQYMDTPYPGGNLFSLASGGAIFLRDPHRTLEDNQLNGGTFGELTEKDWNLILPYLQENEHLFGIKVADLLTLEGKALPPSAVYRKVHPLSKEALRSIAAHQ